MKTAVPNLPPNLSASSDLGVLFDEDDDLEELHVADSQSPGLETSGATIRDSLIEKSDLSATDMKRFDVHNCKIVGTNLTGSKFAESSWRTIAITGCRASGVQFQNSTLSDVRFVDSKLDLANFRFATMKNVIFENCILDDVDFNDAALKNIEFISCRLNKVSFTGAKMSGVDLSQSTLEEVRGIGSLRGATISEDQLVQLAPYFAAEAGLKIRQ